MQRTDCETRIRQATPPDVGVVVDILGEAPRCLELAGMPMWKGLELEPAQIASDVEAGLFYLAERSGDPAATVRYQLEDPVFWPDARLGDAAYVHRLAVRRRYAGTGLSAALLRWAAERTRTLGRGYLRLDCEASRPRLREVYESVGFRYHSDRRVGPYFVSRYELAVAKSGAQSAATAGLSRRRRS